METLSEIQAKGGPKKLSLIAFSGDFDKLTAVFTLATGAAAVGYEVNFFFTFIYGRLPQSAVFYLQFSRHGEHTCKTIFIGGVIPVPHIQPTYHNRLVGEGLRSVEIKAVVYYLAFTAIKFSVCQIKLANAVEGAMYV